MLDRARDGESFEIMRGEEVVARLVPSAPAKKVCTVADFIAAWQHLPRLEPGDAEQFEKDLDKIRREMVLPEPEWD